MRMAIAKDNVRVNLTLSKDDYEKLRIISAIESKRPRDVFSEMLTVYTDYRLSKRKNK
jgi:hypothetical protein